jgi:hypothetical protein
MKAPKYQRMDALYAAIQTAGDELADPILGVEMTGDGIVAWDGKRAILMSYDWNQGYGADRTPLPGSGNWSATYVRDCAGPVRGFANSSGSRAWWRFW